MGLGPHRPATERHIKCGRTKITTLHGHGLKVSDIGLWELNEAFACQAVYCRDHLGIDPAIYNVDGGGMGAAALFEVA